MNTLSLTTERSVTWREQRKMKTFSHIASFLAVGLTFTAARKTKAEHTRTRWMISVVQRPTKQIFPLARRST